MNHDMKYFNQKKKQYETAIVIGYIIYGLFFLFGLGHLNHKVIAYLIFIIGFLIGTLFIIIGESKFKKLSNAFKKQFLSNEIKKIYPDCTYEVELGFNETEIEDAQIIKLYDKYFTEDQITGSFDGVSFKTADVKVQDVRSNGKSTYTVTTFQGRVYKFAFNKSFISNVLINQPNFLSHLFDRWKRIKMESVQFNSELSVYSDNEHEAFYLLTPHFMEKLLELDRKYYDEIAFSFLDHYLYIAINSDEDTFDLKRFEPIDLSILEEYKTQLNDIKHFIIFLNLNKHLFKE